jgi:SMEK domain/C-terminal domain 10 of the ABC-three component (ABC-3C) systems
MNRTAYYNYIEEKIHTLAHRIITSGKLNMLGLHMHSENFYLHLFNLLYGYKLENLNTKLQNVPAIDLIDKENKIIIQVSATNTKSKIESALEKTIIKEHSDFIFKFISIAKDASNLRKNNFANPYQIIFNPLTDIYDITSIMNNILISDIDNQKAIYQFIRKELGNEIDIVKFDSNLATIINILAKENWDEKPITGIPNSFEIERKITYNDLDLARSTIDKYYVYYPKVDSKYSEFDKMGFNKSKSVLSSIQREYTKLKKKNSADEVFFSIIDSIIDKITNSLNFKSIPIDELELCVDVLVVDAFIRCKLFENPEGYKDVTTR